VKISVITENRQGVLADLTQAVSNIKTNIRESYARVSEEGRGVIGFTTDIYDAKHLDRVMKAIRGVPGVVTVERVVEIGREA
jgi:GTP diphosphokinase / guanosine-3',5'-bis(diphosphate) 3'-diphosphatase